MELKLLSLNEYIEFIQSFTDIQPEIKERIIEQYRLTLKAVEDILEQKDNQIQMQNEHIDNLIITVRTLVDVANRDEN